MKIKRIRLLTPSHAFGYADVVAPHKTQTLTELPDGSVMVVTNDISRKVGAHRIDHIEYEPEASKK